MRLGKRRKQNKKMAFPKINQLKSIPGAFGTSPPAFSIDPKEVGVETPHLKDQPRLVNL